MKKLLSLLTLSLLLTSAYAGAKKETSSYFVKTFNEKGSELNTDKCQLIKMDEEVFETRECFLGDEANLMGYKMVYSSGDSAMVPSISYKGEILEWDEIFSDHDPQPSGGSHFYGVENGVIEVRYYENENELYNRVPFAIIIRVSGAVPSVEDGELMFGKKPDAQELLVFKLDGKKTYLAGKINARQKDANKKAQKFADSLLK